MSNGIIFDIKKYALHDGPGTRTTVFLKGCPLECQWCHNPEGIAPSQQILFYNIRCIACGDCVDACPQNALSMADGQVQINRALCTLCEKCSSICPTGAWQIAGRQVEPKEVMTKVLKDTLFYDESEGGVTFSGGEPLVQADFLLELLQEAKKLHLHTVVDTSGFAPLSTFQKILHLVDLFLYDIKSMDDSIHQAFTGVSNRQILSNIVNIFPLAKEIIVRIPVIPGFNDKEKDILAIGRFIKERTDIRRIDLLPYHTIAQEKYLRLGKPYRLQHMKPVNPSRINELKKALELLSFEVVLGG